MATSTQGYQTPPTGAKLDRQTFTTSRELEYLAEDPALPWDEALSVLADLQLGGVA